MLCPVHRSLWCECAYALRCFLALAAIATAAALSCSPAQLEGPCTPSDATLLVNETQCLARMKQECAGIPLSEPCPFAEECKRFTRERCAEPAP